jgi:MoaA/NifB/PqqE/SkfB family radical SAM enzyme
MTAVRQLTGKAPLRYPEQVNLALTYRCQCTCPMCDQYKADDDGNELGYGDVIALIDRIVGACPGGRAPRFTLCGGECFCLPFAIDVLEHLDSRQIRTEIVTNLGIPDDSVLHRLSRLDHVRVFVSLDGFGATHDSIRGSAGLYRAVKDKLRHMRRLGKRASIYYTISRLNYLDLERTFVDVRDDIDGFHVLHLNWHGERRLADNAMVAQGLGIDDAFPRFPSFTLESGAAVDTLRSMLRRLARQSDRFFPGNPRMGLEAHYLSDRVPASGVCKLLWSELSVHPDGRANFCFLSGKSLRDESLAAVWSDRQRLELAELMRCGTVFPKCARCCMFIPGRRVTRALRGLSRRLLSRSRQDALKKKVLSRLIR